MIDDDVLKLMILPRIDNIGTLLHINLHIGELTESEHKAMNFVSIF